MTQKDYFRELLRRGVNAEAEPRTLPYSAFHPNAPAMRIHNMPRDRKAQPRSSGLARSGGVHPIKSLEDALQVRFRNSNTRVGDREDDFVTIGIGGHIDVSARRSILQRIVHEILQNLAQLASIAAYAGDVFRQFDRNLQSSRLRVEARGLHTAVYQRRHTDRM